MVRNRFEVEEGGIKGREDRWRDTIAHYKTDKRVYVAELDGRIVGFALPVVQKNGDACLMSLYVLPKVQGQGVGSQLMHSSLKWLKADQKPVSLEVVEANKPAIKFYEHHG